MDNLVSFLMNLLSASHTEAIIMLSLLVAYFLFQWLPGFFDRSGVSFWLLSLPEPVKRLLIILAPSIEDLAEELLMEFEVTGNKFVLSTSNTIDNELLTYIVDKLEETVDEIDPSD